MSTEFTFLPPLAFLQVTCFYTRSQIIVSFSVIITITH